MRWLSISHDGHQFLTLSRNECLSLLRYACAPGVDVICPDVCRFEIFSIVSSPVKVFRLRDGTVPARSEQSYHPIALCRD